jgi:hypothetical protein
MSLSTPAITNAQLKMTVSAPSVAPLSDTLAVALPLAFSSVSSLKVLSGTFTPANNAVTLATFASSGVSPNFVILMTDGQVNLTLSGSAADYLVDSPMNKLFFFITPQLGGDYISQIVFNGLSSPASVAMPQGVAVNYTLIYGQATIS